MTGDDATTVLVVGGGPAGQACALRLAEAGVSVTVVDEQARPGGQIARQPPVGFRVPRWLGGRAYAVVRRELARFEAAGAAIRWCGGRSVIGLERAGDGFRATLSGADGISTLHADRVVIATGCYDLPVPLPGWTLPGAMSAGAIQAFVKGQQLVPGERILLAGTHPLMLVVADQIVAGGGTVAGVLFDQSFARMMRAGLAHPRAAIEGAAILADAAAAVLRLRRAGVPIRFGAPLLGIEGVERGKAVAAARHDGRGGAQRIACDRVGLCYGFVPQSDLPRQLGARIRWAEHAGGWATIADGWGQTSVPGLVVAGETTGVAGAAAAAIEGEIAALGLLTALGAQDDRHGEALRGAGRRLARARRFAALLDAVADPRAALARFDDPADLLCRCEDVRRGTIAAALDWAAQPNAVKLLTRCGMGVCQGRMCEPALTRMVAQRTGSPPDPARAFAARFPSRPVAIADLIAEKPCAERNEVGAG